MPPAQLPMIDAEERGQVLDVLIREARGRAVAHELREIAVMAADHPRQGRQGDSPARRQFGEAPSRLMAAPVRTHRTPLDARRYNAAKAVRRSSIAALPASILLIASRLIPNASTKAPWFKPMPLRSSFNPQLALAQTHGAAAPDRQCCVSAAPL